MAEPDSGKRPHKTRIEETDDGPVVFNVPFPLTPDEPSLRALKDMGPIVVKQTYRIDYIHSYGQDSPFFAGLANGVFLGSREPDSGYTYATPRGHDMYSGEETDWVVLPAEGTIHTFTVCYFGSEEFLSQTPFVLILVEFEGADTLFLARLVGVDPASASLDWIGRRVQARYLRNSKLKPTDVYFVLAKE